MMSFSMVIVLESFALIDVVRWGINVRHIAANGDDARFDNSQNPICKMLILNPTLTRKRFFHLFRVKVGLRLLNSSQLAKVEIFVLQIS